MASHKPAMSITLPRDFKFSYTDAAEPRTPAPASEPDVPSTVQAPPPPKQTFKLRRRRADQPYSAAMDEMAIPTIEMTQPYHPPPPQSFSQESTPGYLAPRARPLRLLSPPKTPASQVTSYTPDTSDASEWSMLHSIHPHDIERPLSAMSTFSDSSATSFGSSNDSQPSFEAGSCTSPDSDFADPFNFYELKSETATTPTNGVHTAKRVKTTRHPNWTPEMDNHLWITYMVYVQDPRVTPFKMLPGTAPPLGVCHRVAREAKHTWRGHRLSHGPPIIPRISIQRADSPDAMSVPTDQDETTPTAAFSRKSVPLKWPRSEAATRRRLRELCKRKPSLSAHYVRLLHARSPSPFESSSSSSNSSPMTAETSAFSSRSMNVSLAEATAPSMQPNGPLANLARATPQCPPAPQAPQRRSSDWFARIGRSQARATHQKSQSLQLGLGLGSTSGLNSNTFERGSILASPFDADSSRQSFLESMNSTQSLGRAFFNNRRVENDATLNSPLQFDGQMPSVRSLKRRFGVEDEASAPQEPSLEDIFTAPPTSIHHPMRNRGFSLSAMGGAAQNNFSPLFSPASSNADHEMGEASGSHLQAPKMPHPPRLGSPFSANSRFNTFPRRFTPREAGLQEQPFEERIRQLAEGAPPGS